MVSQRLIAVSVLIVFMVGGLGFVASDSSDAFDVPNPPSASHTVDIVTASYASNGSPQSYRLWDIDRLGCEIASADPKSYTMNTTGCPSWIKYSHTYGVTDVVFTVSPGYPAEQKTYWMMLERPGFSVLFKFHVTVVDSGTSIPDPNYNVFTLFLDTTGGNKLSMITKQVLDGNCKFKVSEISKPTREGYKFIGWSERSDASSIIVSEFFELKKSDGMSDTLYAVWEKNERPGWVIPSVWDDIVEFLSEPGVWIIIGIGSLLFIVFMRRRVF